MKVTCACLFLAVMTVSGQIGFDPYTTSGNQPPPAGDPNLINLQNSFSTQLAQQNPQNQNLLNINPNVVVGNPNDPNQNLMNNPNMMNDPNMMVGNPNDPNQNIMNNPNMMNDPNMMVGNPNDPNQMINNQNMMNDPNMMNNPNAMVGNQNNPNQNTMNDPNMMNDPNRADTTIQPNQNQNQVQFNQNMQPHGSILQAMARQNQNRRRPDPFQQYLQMMLLFDLF